MELRGERECRACGTRWSYYETESVVCPDCGSLRSVAVDEGAVHTGGDADLDLSDARAAVDDEPLDRVATLAAEAARDYRRDVGFVSGGDLRPLPDEYLLAAEVEAVGSRLAREMQVTEAAEHYFLTLLRVPVEGERPGPDAVPAELRAERGLAVSRSVDAYRRDLRTYLDDVDGVTAPVRDCHHFREFMARVDADSERVAEALRERGFVVHVLDEETVQICVTDANAHDADELVAATLEVVP